MSQETATQTALEILEAGDRVPQFGVLVFYNTSRLRQMAATIRKNNGGFTSEQVEAFLSLYGEALKDALDTTVKKFLQEKLG